MAHQVDVANLTLSTFKKGLDAFEHILNKAEEYAKEKGLDADAVFPEARLAEDQLPLTFQVQNATRTVKIAFDRLLGTDSEPFANTEKTLADLHRRIRVAQELVAAQDAKALNDGVLRDLVVPFFGTQVKGSAKTLILYHSFPNFFFHLNAGYQILRSKGVPVGKADYLGSFLQ